MNGVTDTCIIRQGICAEPGQVRYDILFAEGAGPLRHMAFVCLQRGEKMLTVDDVGDAVKQNWVAYVPEQHPTMQPPNGAIVQLPAIFDSGQPAKMPLTRVHVFRFDVMVTATPTWTWTFAPGHTLVTDVPGSKYPDTTVSYTYIQSGPHSVTLLTSWKGTFSVGDYGPYDIDEPATQGPSVLTVDVDEIHPVLTG